MMKKYILLLTIAAATFVGCKKEDPAPVAPCQKGTMQIVNESGFKFDIEADNKQLGQVSGKSTLDFELSNGGYYVKIVQFEGFVASPKVHEHNVTIVGCKTQIVTIPKTSSE